MLRSKISLSLSAALLLGMVSITGCGTNNTATGNVQTKNVRGLHDGRLNVNNVPGRMNVNNFDSMEMSQELADRIAAMPEVRTANVLLAGKSAYVAVTLNETSAGTHATSITGNTSHMNSYSGMNRPSGILPGTGGAMTGAPGMTGMGRPSGILPGARGTVTGTPGMTGTGGSMAGVPGNITGRGTVGGTGLVTPAPRSYVGNNTVDGRTLKRDIEQGMGTAVGTRSITPYSTNNVANTENVTRELKDKIGTEIKKYNKGIDNVYVSANPDFVERANFYADQFRAGHPLRGFANEFRTMVERIFPTRSGY